MMPLEIWNLGRLTVFAAAIYCLATPVLVHSQEDTAGPVTPEARELEERITLFEKEQAEITAPFQLLRGNLREKYTGAVRNLVEKSQKAGDLETALALKGELEASESGADIASLPIPGAAEEELSRLRDIFTSESNKFDVDEGKKLAPIRERLVGDLRELELEFTKAGRLQDAVTARTLRENTETEISKSRKAAIIADAPGGAIDAAKLERMREKGGRLYVWGKFRSNISAVPLELGSLPTDFVAVYAYRTAFVAIRKSGNSYIFGTDREREKTVTNTDKNVTLATKGYDSFIYSKDQLLHRLVRWELDFPNPISNPIAVAGGHCTALLLNSRGDTHVHDGISKLDVARPSPEVIENLRDLYSSKHTFMIVKDDGKGIVWDMRAGTTINVPTLGVANIVDADGGQDHYIILDKGGSVITFYANGGGSYGEVPDRLGDVIKVEAGGLNNAVQRSGGAWHGWGESKLVSQKINQIGLALDLDFYVGEEAEFVVWIEPVP